MIATTNKQKRRADTLAKVALIPAVAYIRMSDPSQTESPAQQKSEVIRLAKQHGYKIVEWYQDHGITGDSIEERPGFCKMLADAQRGKFKAILCWDQDRFGRFDIIRAGVVIHPLREAGVCLVTVAQGKINWNDFAGRLMYAIQQEGKYQYLVDLSRNVLRGKIATAQKGNWQGTPPLGYDRQYFDGGGDKVKLVPFGETFQAPDGWRCRLVPSDNAELIRWIFDEFTKKENSFRGIAKVLDRRAVKPPRGEYWPPGTIKGILRNPAYPGHTVIGKISPGKYHQIGADAGIAAKQDDRGLADSAAQRQSAPREISTPPRANTSSGRHSGR